MLKASALYIVIVIALVIGLLCSSLIGVAYFYRLQYQLTLRQATLQDNLSSAVNLLTVLPVERFKARKVFSLFGNNNDSVAVKSISWGLYDIGLAKAFVQKDSLFASFIMANPADSGKWAALYIIDEDRPISVSGKTAIKGDAYLPKAGIKEAYVDNKSYQGDKKLVSGHIKYSDRQLPVLNADRLKEIGLYFSHKFEDAVSFSDSVNRSFFSTTQFKLIDKDAAVLKDVSLSGSIILKCDTTLVIENSARLENIIILAKAIVVKSGFTGSCQLFATDSVSIQNNCTFNYPSVVGVVRLQQSQSSSIARLTIGENCKLTGIVFTYDANNDKNRQPYLGLYKNANVTGLVYSHGMLELKTGINITGSVFTNRFLYKSGFAIYENYIIDATLSADALSKYYVHSDLVPVVLPQKRVLKWLEKN